MYIEKICSFDHAFKFQSKRLRRKLNKSESDIYQFIDEYLEEFCIYYSISPEQAANMHNRFCAQYQQDIDSYLETDLFPSYQDSKCETYVPDRIAYDLTLIMSTLLESHRFEIIKWLCSYGYGMSLLIIGVGSGLEIALVRKFTRTENIDAYDIQVSDFVKNRFIGIVKEELYDNRYGKRYDSVLAIEVIEHVENPAELMKTIKKSLLKDGKCLLTTIKNVPQFDHLHNFNDDKKFENELFDIGFDIEYEKIIPHQYFVKDISASNTLYLLKNM